MIRPENRDDEIGIAERELAQMQRTLLNTLGERKRLADLGLAVSKINHDMRNMLASAHLISDRLATIEDPTVQSLTPRLLRTLDRAVSYSEGVLAYGRTQEEPPRLRRVRLRALVDDVLATLPVETDGEIALENQVEPDLEIRADPDQLFRVLANLSRNAVQAMGADSDSATVRALSIASQYRPGMVTILVSDTGPGLPTRARQEPLRRLQGCCEKRRDGAWPGHRARTRARPWRHAGACGKHSRQHGLRHRTADRRGRIRCHRRACGQVRRREIPHCKKPCERIQKIVTSVLAFAVFPR